MARAKVSRAPPSRAQAAVWVGWARGVSLFFSSPQQTRQGMTRALVAVPMFSWGELLYQEKQSARDQSNKQTKHCQSDKRYNMIIRDVDGNVCGIDV